MKTLKTSDSLCLFLIFFFPFFLLVIFPVFAEDTDCTKCHESLSKGKVIHQALSMGCTTCHSAIDTNTVPHKTLNRNSKGLSTKQLDLCYGCHDKSQFMKNNVHSAIVLGCTSCHDPHSSSDAKLLVSNLPELCFNCHEKNLIVGKNNSHQLTAGEMCTSCHNPHSTDAPQLLLTKKPQTYVMKK